MKPRAFMLMGTGSDVGKSLVAGIEHQDDG